MALTQIKLGGLADNSVDTDQLADNAVGLAEMASGTDGALITYDTSGNPVAITGNDGQVATSAGANAVSAFEVIPTQYSTRYFYAHLSANQSFSEATHTLVELDTVLQGGTSGFNTSTNTWTAAAADVGVWVFNGQVSFYGSSNNMSSIYGMFYLNGTIAAGGYGFASTVEDHPSMRHFVCTIQQVISISENDTIKLYGRVEDGAGLNFFGGDTSGGQKQTSIIGHMV